MITAKLVTLKAGYPVEQREVEELGWNIGDEFEVENISVGQSSSGVTLKGLGYFNTVFFDFYEDGEVLDVYSDKRFNTYLGLVESERH